MEEDCAKAGLHLKDGHNRTKWKQKAISMWLIRSSMFNGTKPIMDLSRCHHQKDVSSLVEASQIKWIINVNCVQCLAAVQFLILQKY